MKFRSLHVFLGAVLVALVLEPRPAHAYLDPSTGSMLVSSLVAIGATVALGFRTYLHRILSWVRGDQRTQPAETKLQEERPEHRPEH